MADPPVPPGSTHSPPHGVTTGAACPSCGVMVPFGYVSCPKCHTRMSRAHAAGPLRATSRSGGTAVEGAEPSAGWLAAVALLVIGAGVAVYLMTRSERPGPAPEAREVEDRDETVVEPAGDYGDEPSEDEEPARAPRRSAEAERDREAALDELRTALDEQRLWAQVTPAEGDPDVVAVESKYCADAKLVAAVDAALARLRALEFSSVQCSEPHGALVFEKKP